MVQATTHAEMIAASAAVAAWAGACASTFASIVALGVAVWSARREEARRQRLASEQEIAFCFGMVGALERLKPLIAEAREQTGGEVRRREFRGVIEHTQTITEAALAIQVFDMQMLRDAYGFQGVLGMLRTLLDEYPSGPIPCADIRDIVEPRLDDLLNAGDRFFARLPSLEGIEGVHGSTPVSRVDV